MVRRWRRMVIVDEKRVGEPGNLRVVHGREVAKPVQDAYRAVFFDPLLRVSPLCLVEPARVAAVVPGKDPSLRVDLDAKRIPTPFGEHLVAAGFRVIAPDELAHRVQGSLVEPR